MFKYPLVKEQFATEHFENGINHPGLTVSSVPYPLVNYLHGDVIVIFHDS